MTLAVAIKKFFYPEGSVGEVKVQLGKLTEEDREWFVEQFNKEKIFNEEVINRPVIT